MTWPKVLLDRMPVATLEWVSWDDVVEYKGEADQAMLRPTAERYTTSATLELTPAGRAWVRSLARLLVGRRLAHRMLPRRARRAEQRAWPRPSCAMAGPWAVTLRPLTKAVLAGDARVSRLWGARSSKRSWDREVRRAWVRAQGRHDWAMREVEPATHPWAQVRAEMGLR